jgi:glutamine amidotransferase-like uncharacterized protein
MKPLILVYVDHPMCSIDCADATCEVLNRSGLYDVRLIGPSSYPYLEFNVVNIAYAKCLVFPGGLGDADQFDENLINHKQIVYNYVSSGGKYLGICKGAYFASKHYFDLLSDITAEQHIKRPGASTRRCSPAIVPLKWRNKENCLTYFHDGASFVVTEGREDACYATIHAFYKNGDAAALIQPLWNGRIGVIGPHPEAMRWWFYSQSRIHEGWKNPLQHDLLLDFVAHLIYNVPHEEVLFAQS